MGKKTSLDVTIKRDNVCSEHIERYCITINGNVYFAPSYRESVKMVLSYLLCYDL